jgi:GDP-mannose 4,6-dehydratase
MTQKVVLSYLTNCRICQNTDLIDVISLGEQVITSRFPVYGDFSTPKTSIVLCMCQQCGLIQLKETTNSDELYEHEYGYRSGISNTMRSHLKLYKEEICSIVNLKEGDTIVDIGSNDSTMLQYYGNKYRRIGVDPTGKQFKQYYGEVELLPTYFTRDNFVNHFGNDVRCKMVSSISMFYDLPNPVQFAKDIYSILEKDGIWTCEQSYLLTMLRTNSIDTICHEHLEYYALHQVKEISDRAGFKIIDVKFNDCNGGSFRVYFAKKESDVYQENTELIHQILKEEEEYGIMNTCVYSDFMKSCDTQVKYLKDFIENVNSNGKKVYVYGASTKGNCLLQYADLGENQMKYAVERNPKKVGKMTSTGIEIIIEETMRENPPDYLLVLPWHFKTEILEREKEFLDMGGQFIFPFPQFEIIGSKPKLLITGCDGMISHYVKEQFTDYNLYGISRSSTQVYEKNITKFYFDMNDSTILENVLSIVKPDVIIHLASISSSQYAFKNPIETLHCNGLLTATLCEIIHKKGWNTKLFNASSSEIYKGHIDYQVQEDDHHMFHLHPYSIAKIMGHSMVDFYRNTYGLPFSNGVIFTTESPLKRPEFLLNKISAHIKEWKNGNKTTLQVGSLESCRNILHASDVANAIHTIVSQEKGDTYLISSDESHKIYDLVVKLYSISGIDIEKGENALYEKESGLSVLVIQENNSGLDSRPINIRGDSVKLRNLGWKQLVSIEQILSFLL